MTAHSGMHVKLEKHTVFYNKNLTNLKVCNLIILCHVYVDEASENINLCRK